MRGITLTLMAFLAMASVTFGAVTFDYALTSNQTGYRTMTVRATGVNICALSKFIVTGNLYQVQPIAGEMSEWVNEPLIGGVDPCPVNPLDSYVIYGDTRYPTTGTLTEEDVVAGQGLTTDFTNYRPDDPETPTVDEELCDAYGDTNAVLVEDPGTGTPITVDLLQLSIPDGQTVSIAAGDLVVLTAGGWTDPDGPGGAAGYFTTITEEALGTAMTIYSIPGDCNMDGFVDGVDVANFADGWNGGTATPMWLKGDFNGNGYVAGDGVDVALFASGWFSDYGTGGGGGEAALAAPIPEPGTIVMLVLGSLCLVGYRLRK